MKNLFVNKEANVIDLASEILNEMKKNNTFALAVKIAQISYEEQLNNDSVKPGKKLKL